MQIEPVSPALLEAGWDLCRKWLDKGWGLTDCTSFTLMERLGLREAATTDHHFEQAGFTVLL